MIARDRWLEELLMGPGRVPTYREGPTTLERAAMLAPEWGRLEVRAQQKRGRNRTL
jgi:hypothetical protein